jgi:hypothetical protein
MVRCGITGIAWAGPIVAAQQLGVEGQGGSHDAHASRTSVACP